MQFSILLFCFRSLTLISYLLFLFFSNAVILEFEIFIINSVPFIFTIILDKISISFRIIVTLISGCVFIFSRKYIEEDEFYWRFTWILLRFVISINLLIFSGSLFFLLLGWDGLGITSFALIIYYQRKESLAAGFQTLIINRLGDVIIVCRRFFYVLLGQYTFSTLSLNIRVLILILCLAGLTKSAQFPFSSWLPAAIAAPTPVRALVHSSTLVTAGIYIIIRFRTRLLLRENSSSILLFCGSITCFLGGTAAIFENDLKKIVALSTLRQLGVMVFCLGLGLPILALFHLYTHALFKALLFLAAGTILISRFGNQDIRILGSLRVSIPLCIVIFNIRRLCLIGAPFISAFFSKHLILEKIFISNINLFRVVVILIATCNTAFYVIRRLKTICWSKPSLVLISVDNNNKIYLPIIILGSFAIFFGKIYRILDFNLLEIVFINNLIRSIINFVTFSGLWFGIIFLGRQRSYIFSSLFFITPLFSLSIKILAPINKIILELDYGWLEIAPNIEKIILFLNKYIFRFNWPNFLAFNRIRWILFIILIVFNINF